MKKIIIILITIVLVVTIIIAVQIKMQMNAQTKLEQIYQEYEQLKQTVITGNDVATLMNRTIDRNQSNTTNIEIHIRFLESDKTFTMEQIANKGIETFIKNYSIRPFKCTNIEYEGKQITRILIEEIEVT